MRNAPKYSIAVKGLSEGKHTFSFDIDDTFFTSFGGSEVEQGKLIATVNVDKKSTFLELHAHIKGTAIVVCDRCLDDLTLPIDDEYEAIVKFANPDDDDNNDDEGIIWVDLTESEIDLSQFLFDNIVLSLPLQRIHPAGKCNKEMIEKLASIQIN